MLFMFHLFQTAGMEKGEEVVGGKSGEQGVCVETGMFVLNVKLNFMLILTLLFLTMPIYISVTVYNNLYNRKQFF